MTLLCARVCLQVSSLVFTSTRLFVQQLVPRGAVALIADSPVPADVRAAAIVVGALIQACTIKGSEEEGQRRGRRQKQKGKVGEITSGDKLNRVLTSNFGAYCPMKKWGKKNNLKS